MGHGRKPGAQRQAAVEPLRWGKQRRLEGRTASFQEGGSAARVRAAARAVQAASLVGSRRVSGRELGAEGDRRPESSVGRSRAPDA